jgi:hypothetical protein
MIGSLTRMRDAAAVFALCESCAVLLSVLLAFSNVGRLPSLAVGCAIAALIAACLGPTIARLQVKPACGVSVTGLLCGAGISVVSLLVVAALRYSGVARHLLESAGGYPWSLQVQLWVGLLLPGAWWLFVLAGVVAAWLLPRVSCTQTA